MLPSHKENSEPGMGKCQVYFFGGCWYDVVFFEGFHNIDKVKQVNIEIKIIY